jgi:nicotinamide-nucleotide amidase
MLRELFAQHPKLTVAAAESLTCGQVQTLIGAESGSSAYFLGGITAYSLAQKMRHLGVDRALAEPVNSVSAAVAEQMARGVCALFGSDLGLATTGYAEPWTSATAPKRRGRSTLNPPFAWWALAHCGAGGVVAQRSGRIECSGATRREVQQMVAEAVLGELAEYLRALPRPPRSARSGRTR